MFLVARLDTGPWVRISGLSGFEWSVFKRVRKEARTVDAFRAALRPGMTVLDSGANIGYYSLTAAPLVGDDGSVHAFEPTPGLARRISENARMNGFGNIRVNACAVADRVGTAVFHLSSEDSEANSLFAVEDACRHMEVPVTSLDAYVSAAGVSRVDVVKIDCEGAELKVLYGARGMLMGPEPPLLFLELNDQTLRQADTTPEALVAFLDEVGFDCYELERLPEPRGVVLNLLGVSRDTGRNRFPWLEVNRFRPYAPGAHATGETCSCSGSEG
jgi:FkbM family methyltransferase